MLHISISTWLQRAKRFCQIRSFTFSPDRELHRTFVRSSSIVTAGYDEGSQRLQVEYLNGWIYEAHGVPARVFDHLIRARHFGPEFRHRIVEEYDMQRVGRCAAVFSG
jgi:hypothetical protein